MVDDVRRVPHEIVVAILTDVRGLDVGRILPCRADSVMAVGAIGRNRTRRQLAGSDGIYFLTNFQVC